MTGRRKASASVGSNGDATIQQRELPEKVPHSSREVLPEASIAGRALAAEIPPEDGASFLQQRISFARFRWEPQYPDLLYLQLDSFREFLQEDVPPQERRPVGLQQAFLSTFPVEDATGTYQLEFLYYWLEPPRYSEEECRERELTYAKTLKARFRLSSRVSPESEDYIEPIEQDVYLGNIPIMTDRGTFIINGSERVIVSQIHRSPGVFFDQVLHPSGLPIYSARIIPLRGAWLEFVIDINEVMYVYIDRRKKFPVTTFLRALGYSHDHDIDDLFGLSLSVDPREVEQYVGRRIASEIVDLSTGEILAHRGEVLSEELTERLRRAHIASFRVFTHKDPEQEPVLVKTFWKDVTRNREEALELIYRQMRSSEAPDLETAVQLLERLFFTPKRYELDTVGRYRINTKLGLQVPLEVTHLTVEDIVATIRYLLEVAEGRRGIDDQDHLANRRVRTVCEQLTAQMVLGLSRMARTIRDRLSTFGGEERITPAELVNARTINSVLNQFFGTNQLSQFMDQTNPLAELTHKRRVSALGPGGLNRERAGFEVRDVHYTHYGRLCPIETPEGPNIGLISSLALYARVNKYGFIETPYRRVVEGRVTNEIVYLAADDEEDKVIAPASTPVDEEGRIAVPRVRARRSGDFVLVAPEEVDYMDVATDQITSASASLIPFLEHDDANRALMGSNMQRQAVPLVRPEAPFVGTGLEGKIARDSRALLLAEGDGVVEYVSADTIRIRYDDTASPEEKLISFDDEPVVTYRLKKFVRSNQDTCINQRPLVRVGQRVRKGQPIADGAATDRGELALGRNVLVAFMPWRGYNFEDAIVISERLVAEDVFTSIHIEEFTAQVRDTKRGEEEFTRDIPNVSEEEIRNLDDNGLVRVGTRVKEGDILIGKITPKVESDPLPEEKLLRAIFGDRAGDVRDVSLRVPAGFYGTVINTKLFSRRFYEDGQLRQRDERRRREQLQKKEQELLRQLDEECVRRLGRLLDGQRSLGIVDREGRTVVRAGTKLVAEELMKRFEQGKLRPEELDAGRQPWVEDEHTMGLVRQLLQRYLQKRESIKKELRAEQLRLEAGEELPPGVLKMAKVYVAQRRKIQVGDKMAGRHGNKGVVAKIVPVEDMPFLPDGTPVDIVLNPLGVPSRMNLGQLLETALGWVAAKLGVYFASPVFDGATWEDVQEWLRKAGLPPDGKTILYDGRTGEPFHERVTVGYIYMMKLIHMVEDKIHARSTGPYALITQQPLGGRSRMGGQRLGEMEVWALEAYGAAYTLQEMLTLKSDDVVGRAELYAALVNGKPTPNPHIPEAFRVLQRELQGLALEVEIVP
ncbi:MAG: DNA-directed RNA polymerase subunit beta [Candidatus Kapabacteria bacterium]|nr:DNA-directed RNA polymerase subunit beta [Candidatus Kapabacteria bacterium]MDW8012745.1 DNA-directed RNA polymerase subunit beta [Bacteroidota bacterium]